MTRMTRKSARGILARACQHEAAAEPGYWESDKVYIAPQSRPVEKILPPGWTADDLRSLRDDLVTSHISALLSPEKLQKDDWYSSAEFVRRTCVQASALISAILDRPSRADGE